MHFGDLFRKPLVAAVLSFLFPGLGQAAAGDRRRGAIVAIPALATVAAFIFILIFWRKSLLNAAFDTTWLTSLLLLDLVALLYHGWAVVDSYLVATRSGKPQSRQRSRRGSSPSLGTAGAMGAILILTVAVHGAFASVDMDWQGGVNCVQDLSCFAGATLPSGQTFSIDTNDPNLAVVTDPSASGSSSSASAPSASGTIAPGSSLDLSNLPSFIPPLNGQNWAADGQFNVLLLGVDYEPGTSRTGGLRPDTMMVLHMDIASGRAALISVPRGTQCVPLPKDIGEHYLTQDDAIGCPAYTWPYMLNWLAGEAGWGLISRTPAAVKNFPFYQDATAGQTNDPLALARAVEATSQAISTLTGLVIDGYVLINIQGLTQLIDTLGGIDITVPTRIVDYPCGPSGTFESKWRVCDLNPPTASNPHPVMSSRVHDGYQVPPGQLAEMTADAAKSGGKQTITWHGSTDPQDGTGIAFNIAPGTQHMDGPWAVAYARSRIYYTDWDRNLRQQLVLKSLRSSVDPCTMLTKIGDLGSLIKSLSMFNTNLPLSDVSEWAGMAQKVLGGSVQSFNFDPTTLGTPRTTYISQTTWAKAKDIVGHSLDKAPTSGSSGGGGGGGFGC